MIRIGQVGLGFMGRVHFQQYAKMADVKVVAVADIDPAVTSGQSAGGWDNLGKGGDKTLSLEGIKTMADYRQLIQMPEVDVVDICVPTDAHLEIALAGLAAGKHVVCEKPLTIRSADAAKLAEAAKKAKGFFMPAMVMRFWPEWAWIKEAVESGKYGAVKNAVFRRVGSHPGRWYSDFDRSGGALFDLHVHDVDFIYYLFGKPQSVFSRGDGPAPGQINHIVTQYQYPKVPIVAAEGGFGVDDKFGFLMRCTLNFERATVDFDLGRGGKTLMLYHDGQSAAIEVDSSQDGYYRELEYFIGCIREGQRPSRVTADDAVEGIKIIEAERQSATTGQSVKL